MEPIVERVKSVLSKNKYVLLVVLAGFLLMLLPTGKGQKKTETAEPKYTSADPQEELEAVLSQIQGVGRVTVLLTILEGEQTLYAYDEDDNDANGSTSTRRDAVLVTDAQRNQSGLILQIIPPVYKGAVIVCQGGDDPKVRLAVVEAVGNATGLSADKISVLKMK